MDTEKCCCRNLVMLVSGIIFAAVALVHLLRACFGWPAVFNGSEVPMWASWVSVVVGVFMSAWNFCALCCKKCNVCDAENTQPPQK